MSGEAAGKMPAKSSVSAVSVIMPFYKEIHLIDRAVGSVAAQELPPDVYLEVIIGNDSRLSETEIRLALSDPANRITRIVNNTGERGAGNARNAALDSALGDLIAFLDADDYWLPGRLARQMRLIAAGANFVAGAYRFDGRRKIIRPPQRILSAVESLKNLGIGTSTVLLRREFLGTARFKNLRFSQDTELWARLAGKPGFAYAATQEVVAVYAPSRRTANKFRQLLAFMAVVGQFRLSLAQRAGIYLRYAARGVLNHYIRR